MDTNNAIKERYTAKNNYPSWKNIRDYLILQFHYNPNTIAIFFTSTLHLITELKESIGGDYDIKDLDKSLMSSNQFKGDDNHIYLRFKREDYYNPNYITEQVIEDILKRINHEYKFV